MKKKDFLLLLILLFPFISCENKTTNNQFSQNKVNTLKIDLINDYSPKKVQDNNFVKKYSHFNNVKREKAIYPWGKSESPRIQNVSFITDTEKKWQIQKRSILFSATKSSPQKIKYKIDQDLKEATFEFSFATTPSATDTLFKIYLNTSKEKKEIYTLENLSLEKSINKWQDIKISLPEIKKGDDIIFEYTNESFYPKHFLLANPRIFKKEKRKKKPNVIFIVIDALRPDTVNCLHNQYNLTPNIDKIGKDSFLFPKSFTVINWTRPSTIAMLCSVYSSQTGVNHFDYPVSKQEKDYFYHQSKIKSLPTIFKENGYISRSIGQNVFLLDYTGIGIDLDFDDLSEYQTPVRDTVDITTETIEWLNMNSNKEFFLFINYNAPHHDYLPPDKYWQQIQTKVQNVYPYSFRKYMGEVAYTDDNLGKILNKLKELKIYDNSIIVITSDHGEVFRHLKPKYSDYTGRRRYKTHGQTMFDEELNNTLIIKPTKKYKIERKKIETMVRSIDIPPTILELAKIPQEKEFQGESLLKLNTKEKIKDRPLYCEGRVMYAVRTKDFLYSERFLGYGTKESHWEMDNSKYYPTNGFSFDNGKPGFKELYDLKKDPMQKENIVTSAPKEVKRMKQILEKYSYKLPDNFIYSYKTKSQGTLKITVGQFHNIEIVNGSGKIYKISKKEYRFELEKNSKIKFQTIPAYATVELLTEKKLLNGEMLLPLAKKVNNHYQINAEKYFFHGQPEKSILSSIKPNLLYWNIPIKGTINKTNNSPALSGNINKLLQDWGYIQANEKKEKKK